MGRLNEVIMNLLQFINNRTEELLDEHHVVKSYSLKRHSETEALKQALSIVKFFVKWTYVLRVFAHFLCVKTRIARVPVAVLAKKKIEEDNKKLRKIGMSQLKRGEKEDETA